MLGILSIVLCGPFTGIPAIIYGHRARATIAEGNQDDAEAALAGILLGWFSIGVTIVAFGFLGLR